MKIYLAMLVGCALSAQAAVLARYEFSVTGGSAYNPTVVAQDLSSSQFQLINAGTRQLNATSVNTESGGSAVTGSGFNTATLTRYFQFTMTPVSGMLINTESFSFFNYVADPGTARIYASYVIDGQETFFISDLVPHDGSAPDVLYKKVTVPLVLSGVADPVSVRIYGYNFPSSSKTLRLDDVTVLGEMSPVIPEPSTAFLLVFAAAVMLYLRRREGGRS